MSVSYCLEKLRAVVHVSKWLMTVWQGASTLVNSLKYNSLFLFTAVHFYIVVKMPSLKKICHHVVETSLSEQ